MKERISDLTISEMEFLIKKMRNDGLLTEEDSFEYFDDKIVWKQSCPCCCGDMDFSFGDFLEEYLSGKEPIDYMAFCFNEFEGRRCSGHIDNNGMVC